MLEDRNSTGSHRSKLKSRTALIGEHPNPLNLVQLKDAMIQHRNYVMNYERLASLVARVTEK